MLKSWPIARIGVFAAVVTTVAVLCGGVATATTVRVQTHHVSGTVSSVNGSTTPGVCGTAGSDGAFTLPTKSTGYTIDVGASSTAFKEKGDTAPTFASVCVGDRVRAIGTLSTDDVLTAAEVVVTPPSTQRVSGIVSSVNGSTTPGVCGTPGSDGDFTVPTKSTTYTVDVGATTTTFKEQGVSAPSFAVVCVGDNVRAVGPISTNDVVNATAVTVTPPRLEHVSGTVSSVNGSTAPGVCGTAGTAGDFTVPTKSTTYTVDVGATSTTFSDEGVTSPSFADVCVGDKVRAGGPISTDNVVTATTVTVIPPPSQHVSGTVASVNGSGAPGSCGTAGTAGSFTVPTKSATDTVGVGATTTTFKEKGVTAPSFASVCVGDKVQAVGPMASDNVVTATTVTVIPPRPKKVSGAVVSVNGGSTCGAAGSAGTFTVMSQSGTYVVNVAPTGTTFKEQGVRAPSFGMVCAGDKVRTIDTVSGSDNLTATQVIVIPSK